MTIAEEDAAFQDLFIQLDSLNTEYAAIVTPQTLARAGWLRRIFNVVAYDVVGGMLGAGLGSFASPVGTVVGGIVGAISGSISGAISQNKDGRIFPQKFGWPSMSSAYMSSFNNYQAFDKAGDIHNMIIEQMYDYYGEEGLKAMNETQLVEAVFRQMVANRYGLPTNYNNWTVSTIASQLKAMAETKNYDTTLYIIGNTSPTLKNQCTVLNTYINGMSNIDTSTALKYNVDFRDTVNSSSISYEAKSNLCSFVSVGYGSSNLWDIE